MTTVDTHRTSRSRSLAAIAAVGVAALLIAVISTYVATPFKATGSGEWGLGTGHGLVELPFLAAFVTVGCAVVFGVIVARGRRSAPNRVALWALLLAAVGVLSIAVFWSGLPIILAAGAATLAFAARERLGRLPGTGIAALVLAALVTIATIWSAFTG